MSESRPARPLRRRLMLSYAGIALLTTVVLGGVLLGVLGTYYARSERAYLQASAGLISARPPQSDEVTALAEWAQLTALQTQTRVAVIASSGELLADSGSPRDLNVATLSALLPERDEHPPRDDHTMPRPLPGDVFGGATDAVSGRTLAVSLTGGLTAVVSEAPVSGAVALKSAAQALGVAAVLGVLLGAAAGYLVSRRISRPVVELTEASDRMATGDLSARTSVAGDDEIAHLGASFNAMAARVERTVDELQRFVGDAAHEIGTPLTALQADLELASQAATSDDERRLLARALGQARRLEALSGNLLRLSRLETGSAPGEIAVVDLVAVAREAAAVAASRAEQVGLAFEFDASDVPLPVSAVPAELHGVIQNLLDNALKFTPDDGRVTLDVRAEGGHAVLTVSDTGIGIPEAEQAKVFSRFHRARNVASYPGSGLGLAIVKASVERAGGSVTFESSEAGTSFRVRLPRA